MEDVVIAAGVRTPIGAYGGLLRDLPPYRLGAAVLNECIDRKINVNGSGISLGHPIAATGVMRLVTLVHEMRRQGARFGLETIYGGGGQGICGIFEGIHQ